MNICLFEPEIAQNAGAIARLCACFGAGLHIIEPASFILDNRGFHRAGMDYIDKVDIQLHSSFAEFKQGYNGRVILFDTKAKTAYCDVSYMSDDCLLFGRESCGVPDEVYDACDERVVIPMVAGVRSLNVAMSAAIALSEATRQIKHTA